MLVRRSRKSRPRVSSSPAQCHPTWAALHRPARFVAKMSHERRRMRAVILAPQTGVRHVLFKPLGSIEVRSGSSRVRSGLNSVVSRLSTPPLVGSRFTLHGHEGGNSGHSQGRNLRTTAPAPDPTAWIYYLPLRCSATSLVPFKISKAGRHRNRLVDVHYLFINLFIVPLK